MSTRNAFICLQLVFLSLLQINKSNAADECIKKITTDFGKSNPICDGPSPSSYTVVYKNMCDKKLDVVFALQETSKHWVRFEKHNLAPGDTVMGFVCAYTGKSQMYTRPSGSKSAFPTYADLNKEYFELNGIRTSGNKTLIYAKLYVILNDDGRIAWENSKKPNDKSEINTFFTDRYGVGDLVVDLEKDVTIGLGRYKILEQAKTASIYRGGKEFRFDVTKGVTGEFVFNISKEKAKELLMTTTNFDNLSVKLLVGEVVKEPLVGQRVFYQNKDGEKKSAVTDEFGDFSMKKVNASDRLQIELEKNAKLEGIDKIYIASTTGKVMNEISKNGKGEFSFAILPPILSQMEELDSDDDDPYLVVREFEKSKKEEMTVMDNILYATNSAEINKDASNSLDKLVEVLQEHPDLNVLLIAHTDARGNDESNIVLSEKRAESSVKYLISKGIEPSRVAGRGVGETMIGNRCGNGIKCSEKEHAANRKTEIKFVKNKF